MDVISISTVYKRKTIYRTGQVSYDAKKWATITTMDMQMFDCRILRNIDTLDRS